MVKSIVLMCFPSSLILSFPTTSPFLTITDLFEGNKIRSIWDADKEDYYLSVVDVIAVLTESDDPSDYWTTLKRRLTKQEKSEIVSFFLFRIPLTRDLNIHS